MDQFLVNTEGFLIFCKTKNYKTDSILAEFVASLLSCWPACTSLLSFSLLLAEKPNMSNIVRFSQREYGISSP